MTTVEITIAHSKVVHESLGKKLIEVCKCMVIFIGCGRYQFPASMASDLASHGMLAKMFTPVCGQQSKGWETASL